MEARRFSIAPVVFPKMRAISQVCFAPNLLRSKNEFPLRSASGHELPSGRNRLRSVGPSTANIFKIGWHSRGATLHCALHHSAVTGLDFVACRSGCRRISRPFQGAKSQEGGLFGESGDRPGGQAASAAALARRAASSPAAPPSAAMNSRASLNYLANNLGGTVRLPPPHSITLSALNSSDVGTSRPIAFAVLRLTTISNFVGCCTGRSSGLAPFRILST